MGVHDHMLQVRFHLSYFLFRLFKQATLTQRSPLLAKLQEAMQCSSEGVTTVKGSTKFIEVCWPVSAFICTDYR